LLVFTTPAAGGDIYHRKRAIDERISTLNTKLAHARVQAGVLTQQISVVTAKIRSLQGDVTQAQNRLNTLESQLAVHQQRLDDLNQLFVLQTRKLNLLRRAYFVALRRLELRLIDSYETPGVDEVEYLHQIEHLDKQVSMRLDDARAEMHATRERTRGIKHRVAVETAVVRTRTEEQHSVARALISQQQQLAAARSVKRESLASVQVNEQEFRGEAEALAAESAALAEKIRATEAQGSGGASAGTGVSAQGFIWPVQGPITSPFGPRCLSNGDCSFHPGIDIAVPTGTPIHAAANGAVIVAGWVGGYGNLVAIDHGNGLSTLYGHQSQIAVSVGQSVSQGQVIGYSGCTGYCFGPHLHFEVRVNGTPVDPMRYL